jgi:hypothetical protein
MLSNAALSFLNRLKQNSRLIFFLHAVATLICHTPQASFRTLDQVKTMIEPFLSPDQTRMLKLETFESDFDFFETDLSGFFGEPSKRTLILRVNSKLLTGGPSDSALKGILAHEACHLIDFQKSTRWQLLRLYLCVNWQGEDCIQKYERSTDECSLKFTQGCGLLEYREWLATQLSSDQMIVKNRRYLSAAELKSRLSCPSR